MGKRGTKPGGKLSVVAPARRDRPKPLPGMSSAARYIWKRIVYAYPPDHFKPQHLGLLRTYCETEAQWKRAVTEILKTGAVIEQTNGVMKRNPWCPERDALAAAMAQLATKLAITRNATINTKGSKEEQGSSQSKSKREGLMFNG